MGLVLIEIPFSLIVMMLRLVVAYACHVMVVLILLLLKRRDGVRSRTNLQLEVLALRHQLHALKRAPARGLRLTRFDRSPVNQPGQYDEREPRRVIGPA